MSNNNYDSDVKYRSKKSAVLNIIIADFLVAIAVFSVFVMKINPNDRADDSTAIEEISQASEYSECCIPDTLAYSFLTSDQTASTTGSYLSGTDSSVYRYENLGKKADLTVDFTDALNILAAQSFSLLEDYRFSTDDESEHLDNAECDELVFVSSEDSNSEYSNCIGVILNVSSTIDNEYIDFYKSFNYFYPVVFFDVSVDFNGNIYYSSVKKCDSEYYTEATMEETQSINYYVYKGFETRDEAYSFIIDSFDARTYDTTVYDGSLVCIQFYSTAAPSAAYSGIAVKQNSGTDAKQNSGTGNKSDYKTPAEHPALQDSVMNDPPGMTGAKLIYSDNADTPESADDEQKQIYNYADAEGAYSGYTDDGHHFELHITEFYDSGFYAYFTDCRDSDGYYLNSDSITCDFYSEYDGTICFVSDYFPFDPDTSFYHGGTDNIWDYLFTVSGYIDFEAETVYLSTATYYREDEYQLSRVGGSSWPRDSVELYLYKD